MAASKGGPLCLRQGKVKPSKQLFLLEIETKSARAKVKQTKIRAAHVIGGPFYD